MCKEVDDNQNQTPKKVPGSPHVAGTPKGRDATPKANKGTVEREAPRESDDQFAATGTPIQFAYANSEEKLTYKQREADGDASDSDTTNMTSYSYSKQ